MFRFVLFFLFSVNAIAQDVTLILEAENSQEYGVVGDTAPLNWQAPLPMTKVGNAWSLAVNVDNSADKLEYKYVILNSGKPRFEPITGNRSLDLKKQYSSTDKWAELDFDLKPNLNKVQIEADVESLYSAVRALHERLGIKDNTLDDKTQQLISKLESSSHYATWYQAIKSYLSATTDGVFDVQLSQQNQAIKTVLLDSVNKLPFEYEFVGNKMFVALSPYPKQLPVGAEILKLNQKFVWQVLGLFAESGVESHFQHQLGATHDFQVSEFDLQLATLLPPLANGFVVTYQGKKKPKTEYLPAASWPKRKFALGSDISETPSSVNWRRSMQTDKIAYLQIVSSKQRPLPDNWQQYLKQSLGIFEQNKVPYIILDIRKMTDNNLPLYRHLAALIGQPALPEESYERLTLNGAENAPEADSKLNLTNGHNEKRPEVSLMSGQVYVLYGSRNEPGLGAFLEVVQSLGNVVTVGTEFQSESDVIVEQYTDTLRLENSRFVVSRPQHVWRKANTENHTTSFKPNISLAKSAQDVKQNRDGVLLKLIGQINQAQP